MDLNRNDLIKQLMENYGYTKKSASAIISDFVSCITDNMEKGNTVAIYGFGSFDICKRTQRECNNPQTGGRIIIPEHLVPRFTPGMTLRKAVKIFESGEQRDE